MESHHPLSFTDISSRLTSRKAMGENCFCYLALFTKFQRHDFWDENFSFIHKNGENTIQKHRQQMGDVGGLPRKALRQWHSNPVLVTTEQRSCKYHYVTNILTTQTAKYNQLKSRVSSGDSLWTSMAYSVLKQFDSWQSMNTYFPVSCLTFTINGDKIYVF